MKQEKTAQQDMNEVLRRMLSTPPEPHAPSATVKKSKPKPKKKPA